MLGCNAEQHGCGALATALSAQKFIHCNMVKTTGNFNIPKSLTLQQDLV